MSQKNIFILVVALLVVGIFATLIFRSKTESIVKDYDIFAKCLAEKNFTMYGAEWCTHCQAQKKLFGESFKYIPYVECPADPKICIDKGVESYPTWIGENGEKYLGKQSLEKLSEITGCVL